MDITSVDHVKDHLDNIFPINGLIWIIHIEQVIFSLLHNELESRLYTIILGRSIVFPALPSAFAAFIAVRVSLPVEVLVIVVGETKQRIDGAVLLAHFLLNRFEIIVPVCIKVVILVGDLARGFR